MSSKSSPKDLSFYSASRLVATGSQIAFFLIFASFLTPEQYGEMNYLIALAATASVVSRFGLPHTIIVYQAKKELETSNQINVLALILASISSIILLFFNVFAAALCLVISFFIMNQSNLTGLRKYNRNLIFAIIRGTIILTIPFVLFEIFDITGIIIGLAIGNLAASFDYFKFLKFKKISFGKIKEKFKILFHNFAIELSSEFPKWADKLVIAPFFGFALVGSYQFNFQFLLVIELLPVALHKFLLAEESSGKKHHRITILTIIITSGLSLIAILVVGPLVEFFYPQYLEGIASLQVMLISAIPMSISWVLTVKLQVKESTKIGYTALPRIISVLVLLVILGEIYGLMGFSIAVLSSLIINTVYLFYLYKREKCGLM